MAQARTRSQLALPDDMLLRLPQRSPMKDARKRSMSPTRHSEPPPERESKRAKKAPIQGPRPVHARNPSDPSIPRLARDRSSTAVPPVNGRAQSVPLFPTSYSFPFIDFNNPPPSPHRTRSRSPEKEEPKLRITFVPTMLDIATEERMEVEETSQPTTNAASPCPSQLNPQRVVNREVPSTPAPSRQGLLDPLSPLTPLPETPITWKETRGRPTQLRHAQVFENTNTKARTLQVTLTTNRSEDHSFPPPPSPSIPQAQIDPPPPPSEVERSLLVVPGRKPLNSSSDAFSVMMQARQEKTKVSVRSTLNKGKQRPGVGQLKPSSTSSASVSSNKLRSRMRPREKPKIEDVLNLSVPPETETETVDEAIPEQPELNHGQDTLPSISPAERPSLGLPPVEDGPGETEVENVITRLDDKPTSVTPGTVENSLPDTLHLVTGGSSSNALPEAAEGVPFESASTQEQGPLSTEMVCDQPTERILPRAEQHIDAVVVPNRARLRRKKASSTLVPVERTTRSTASRLKPKEPTVARSALRPNTPVTPRATRSRASTTSPYGKSETTAQRKRAKYKSDSTNDVSLPPGPVGPSSPVRASNYAKPTTSSAAKVSKSPIKTSRTSPTKLNRTSGSRPASALSRLFPTNSADLGAPSSLSTLSTALEKLRMPPPSRPNTSIGFHDTSDKTNNSISITQDGSNTESANLTKGPPSTSTKLRRRSSSLTLPASTFDANAAKPQSTAQQPISMFLTPKQGSNSNMLPNPGSKPPLRQRIFGVGSRGVFGIGMRNRAPKVSRKTSLPMVVGSPIKGGEPTEIQDDNEDGDIGKDADNSLEIVMEKDLDTANLGEDEYLVPIAGYSPEETGKKDKDWKTSSRRASLASLALSASLSALPLKGSMGPPPTIPKHGRVTRSISSSYASASQLASPADEKAGGAAGTNSKAPSSTSSPLKLLKNCVVFVDVRTDEGDDAGSLFVEMLEGAGAKVLTRVGQTCTHIVFKNGLLSTISRYRLLRDPKPHVVGIAWVVECIEQRKRVDESKFLVELSDMNTAGINKRRKSLLPKLVALDDTDNHVDEDGDRSVDGSNSSLILDDLPPLERARRRKSILIGPRS